MFEKSLVKPVVLNRPASGRTKHRFLPAILVLAALISCMALADGSWLKNVPADYHAKVNPFGSQPSAIAGGAKLFGEHCAKCHGQDALGRGKRPSLRTARVQQQATEGDIFWLLKNGNLGHGMPNWSGIPEPSRWQLIAYVKSLGVSSVDNSSNQYVPKENE
jgi:mono/diheme cytochrome c family protein